MAEPELSTIELLQNVITNNTLIMMSEILKKISADYPQLGVSGQDLTEKYLGKFKEDLYKSKIYKKVFTELNSSPQPIIPKEIDPTRCVAKIINNEQCHRVRAAGSEFCGTHKKNLQFGKIESLPHDTQPPCEDVTEMAVVEEIINGSTYYVDPKTDLIYQINSDLKDGVITPGSMEKVGKKCGNNKIEFFTKK